MSTLAEIEAAADALPPEEKQELFLFLAACASERGASREIFRRCRVQRWREARR